MDRRSLPLISIGIRVNEAFSIPNQNVSSGIEKEIIFIQKEGIALSSDIPVTYILEIKFLYWLIQCLGGLLRMATQ